MFAVLASASIASASFGWGATASPIRAGKWTGGASVGPNKQFDRCAASHTNPGGIALAYTMNRQLQWSLELSSTSWSFTNDYSLSVTFNVDGRIFRARAAARTQSVLRVEVEDPIALFSTLRLGGQLKVIAGGLVTEFDLTDSSEALASVAQCAVQNSLGSRRQAAGARAGKDRTALAADPAMLNEARKLATAMREQAAANDFQVLSAVAGLPGSRAALGWKATAAGGVITVFPPGAAPNTAELSGRIRDIEKQRCQGEYFFISTVETLERGDVARLYAACKMTESTSITYYIVVPRPAGGAYAISNTSGEGFALTLQRQAEAVDKRLREILPDALRRFEQETPTAPAPDTEDKLTSPSTDYIR